MAPSWLDHTAYPFTACYFETDAGRMHYVDEGTGPPVLMLHGNPTWSFLYRHLIRHLAPHYRCIAPDYLGFGLSDKPPAWPYRPEDHARHIRHLIDHLSLHDLTLVVQDWGGPIGLSFAVAHPERVSRLVIMNTWMWPVQDAWHFVLFSRLLGSPMGRLLIQQFNLFAHLMPLGFGDRSRLTEAAHRHYLAPLDTFAHRKASWVFPKAILGSTAWLEHLWHRRAALEGKPALLVWGMKDFAFRRHELKRWHTLFPEAEVHRLSGIGHYVQEEVGPDLGPVVAGFLERTA